MKITIQGQDYSAALDAACPLTISRTLNAPSVCEFNLSMLPTSALAIPVRNQALVATGDDGTPYFTGYVAASPMPQYAGMGIQGPQYRISVQAISEEIVLDQILMPPGKGSSGQTAGALMTALVTHTGSAALATQELTLSSRIGSFVAEPGASWSLSAGQVASQARAAYRALSGALALAPVGGTVHPLNEADGSLSLSNLSLSASVKRALANDITVCGEQEPVAYVTEYFLGDGTTTIFNLSAEPFFPPSSKANLLVENFNEAAINLALWSSPTSYFSLATGGLAMTGGNGTDGAAQLAWIDSIEMGGTLLLEAVGLTLNPGSAGVLAAFYAGLPTVSGCIAGFQATAQQGTGAVTLQPVVLGLPSGTSFSVNPANQYTLRVRIHCPENERTFPTYYSCGDNGVITTGGGGIAASAKLLFEMQEMVNGVAAMPVTLYDGSTTALPPACSLVAASSINLQGTLRALNLTNLGSGWVVSTPPDGAAYTRRVGALTESAECHVESARKLSFYTGSAPVVGEQIAVSYRTVGLAVGRAINSASQSSLAQAGLPASAAWIGSVTSPAARSSADCRNAASAMVQASAGVSALWSGSYRATRFDFAADVWPGDTLLLSAPSTDINAQVVVRTAKLSYHSSLPDLIQYDIAFANDWADDLAIKTSATVPAEAWLPAPTALTPLVNLSALSVTTLNGTTVTVNTGVTAPAGGGFEVRRRDFAFMAGEDPDLVLRGSQSLLTFSRQSANDRFYIRMYDGSTPPNYSEFSAGLFINLPLG